MDTVTLRGLVGSERFDRALARAKERKARGEPKPLDSFFEKYPDGTMPAPPDEGKGGITIEQGRKALKRATERT